MVQEDQRRSTTPRQERRAKGGGADEGQGAGGGGADVDIDRGGVDRSSSVQSSSLEGRGDEDRLRSKERDTVTSILVGKVTVGSKKLGAEISEKNRKRNATPERSPRRGNAQSPVWSDGSKRVDTKTAGRGKVRDTSVKGVNAKKGNTEVKSAVTVTDKGSSKKVAGGSGGKRVSFSGGMTARGNGGRRGGATRGDGGGGSVGAAPRGGSGGADAGRGTTGGRGPEGIRGDSGRRVIGRGVAAEGKRVAKSTESNVDASSATRTSASSGVIGGVLRRSAVKSSNTLGRIDAEAVTARGKAVAVGAVGSNTSERSDGDEVPSDLTPSAVETDGGRESAVEDFPGRKRFGWRRASSHRYIRLEDSDAEDGYQTDDESNATPSPLLAQLSEDEHRLAELVEDGDVNAVSAFIRSHPGIDMNATGYQGLTFLARAVRAGDYSMAQLLLAQPDAEVGDCALRAAQLGHAAVLRLLLDHLRAQGAGREVAGCAGSPDFADGTTPLMVAARYGHSKIIAMLLSRGHTLRRPHGPECRCKECLPEREAKDQLAVGVARLELYSAWVAPAFLFHCSADPVLEAFFLCRELTDWALASPRLRLSYLELATRAREFAADLLECCRSQHEVQVMLRQRKGSHIHRSAPLPRLVLAVDFCQKEFVANPKTQLLLKTEWSGDWGEWRSRPLVLKLLSVFPRMLMLPVVTAVTLFAPCSALGRFYMLPVNKFLSDIAAYIIFLGLVFAQSNLNKRWQLRGSPGSGLEPVIFLFVVGHIWSSFRLCFFMSFRRYYSRLRNWYDTVMLVLFVTAFSFWVAADMDVAVNGHRALERKFWHALDPTLLAEGFFVLATILAFGRLLLLLQFSFIFGPLQVAIGKMFTDICKFALIYFMVLFSFACGLSHFYQYYEGMTQKDASGSATTQASSFVSFPRTLITLFWCMFCMSSLDSADVVIENLPGDDPAATVNKHYFTEFVGHFCFAIYMIFTITVLMNMLIATICSTYHKVTDNVDVEWTFGRTEMYLVYMSQTTLPPPLNLLPTPNCLRLFFWWWSLFLGCGKKGAGGVKAKCSPGLCCYIEEAPAEHETEYAALLMQLAQRYFREGGASEAPKRRRTLLGMAIDAGPPDDLSNTSKRSSRPSVSSQVHSETSNTSEKPTREVAGDTLLSKPPHYIRITPFPTPSSVIATHTQSEEQFIVNYGVEVISPSRNIVHHLPLEHSNGVVVYVSSPAPVMDTTSVVKRQSSTMDDQVESFVSHPGLFITFKGSSAQTSHFCGDVSNAMAQQTPRNEFITNDKLGAVTKFSSIGTIELNVSTVVGPLAGSDSVEGRDRSVECSYTAPIDHTPPQFPVDSRDSTSEYGPTPNLIRREDISNATDPRPSSNPSQSVYQCYSTEHSPTADISSATESNLAPGHISLKTPRGPDTNHSPHPKQVFSSDLNESTSVIQHANRQAEPFLQLPGLHQSDRSLHTDPSYCQLLQSHRETQLSDCRSEQSESQTQNDRIPHLNQKDQLQDKKRRILNDVTQKSYLQPYSPKKQSKVLDSPPQLSYIQSRFAKNQLLLSNTTSEASHRRQEISNREALQSSRPQHESIPLRVGDDYSPVSKRILQPSHRQTFESLQDPSERRTKPCISELGTFDHQPRQWSRKSQKTYCEPDPLDSHSRQLGLSKPQYDNEQDSSDIQSFRLEERSQYSFLQQLSSESQSGEFNTRVRESATELQSYYNQSQQFEKNQLLHGDESVVVCYCERCRRQGPKAIITTHEADTLDSAIERSNSNMDSSEEENLQYSSQLLGMASHPSTQSGPFLPRGPQPLASSLSVGASSPGDERAPQPSEAAMRRGMHRASAREREERRRPHLCTHETSSRFRSRTFSPPRAGTSGGLREGRGCWRRSRGDSHSPPGGARGPTRGSSVC